MTRATALLALALWLGAASLAWAQDLPISAFHGQWAGSGIAQNKDSLYFGATVRDLDVAIRPTSDGVNVTWTTMLHTGGDPANPDVRRRSAALDFVPSQRPNLFKARANGDPLAGGDYAWARLTRNTFTIYVLTISEAGVYEMQSYARTLTGSGMDLEFTRVRDGEPVRRVRAKLIKAAD